MTTPFRRTRIAAAVAGVALAIGAGHVFAAGFALQESNGSGLGNAYAGGAAVAEDASTVWANPAGMSRFGTMQAAAALNLVKPSMKFSNNGSINALTQPLGGDGGDAGSLNFVPAMYFVAPINKQWAVGIGISGPFGLVTEYDDGWAGRFQAIKSDVKTVNVNPALSWKINDAFSVGAGFSYQQLKGTFTANANYSAAMAQGYAAGAAAGAFPASLVPTLIASTPGLQSNVSIEGDDWSWGWNVGGLWNIDRNNRIGVHWRSDIKYKVTGNAEVCNPAPNTATGYCGVLLPTVPSSIAPIVTATSATINRTALASGGVYADIKVPGIANVSYFGTLNDRWDVMADVQWTHWSTIQDLTFVRNSGTVFSSVPLVFEDAWRVSGGANYKYNDQWMFRGGLAWDQTPVQDEHRTARLPDSDRIWLNLGVQYKYDKNWKLDLGGSYIFVQDGDIAEYSTNPADVAAYGYLKGSYNNNVIILGGQVSYSF
jgi:long-chain fatty acid transport protein